MTTFKTPGDTGRLSLAEIIDQFSADGRLPIRFTAYDGSSAGPPDARRELFDAMAAVARTGQGPPVQQASIGCSIKWRDV